MPIIVSQQPSFGQQLLQAWGTPEAKNCTNFLLSLQTLHGQRLAARQRPEARKRTGPPFGRARWIFRDGQPVRKLKRTKVRAPVARCSLELVLSSARLTGHEGRNTKLATHETRPRLNARPGSE